MNKQLFVLFNDNKGVFKHILLNVFDLAQKGYEVGIVFESKACKLISEYENTQYEKFKRLKDKSLVAAVCEVCAKAMGALESAQRQGLTIDGTLHGHPSLESWIKTGFHVMLV